ncbi:hypothetical protein [Paracraurococcus ruber]|uniref:Uncharacterized protein n=1 Tax=Paracraurococcus ruber TaxID=77675 RepID=A0ABS1D6B1_9PROT|nr:hypothetical protein [Paracraurococcus ruber]MBK1662430.1 hypothetical protein [Paracraurococcus ruber]TDG25726.1 hypothetical protein E2C05_25615 [Paracraurococcus ruber]
MRVQAVQHWVLGGVVLATVLWLDLLSGEILRRIALFTLAWAAASTLLVGGAGAWIALVRSRQAARRS